MTTKPNKEEREPYYGVKHKSGSFAPQLKYKVLSDEEIEFTKEKAYAFLELETFDGERAVRERHVQFLFDEWAAGRFLWQNIILASARCEGKEYRINGQHTCWMRVNVPERNEPLKVKARLMVYAVDDKDQLRSLYSAFDRGAPRTAGHIGRVLMIDSPAVQGISVGYINRMLAGFRLWFSPNDTKRRSMSINDWCGLIQNNYSTLFSVVGQFMAMHVHDAVWAKRASVIAGMLATFEKNVKASEEFWTPVFNGVALQTKSDPRYQLRRYMETHGHDVASSSAITKVSPEEMYYVCVNMWNHWRAGTSVSNVKSVGALPKIKA